MDRMDHITLLLVGMLLELLPTLVPVNIQNFDHSQFSKIVRIVKKNKILDDEMFKDGDDDLSDLTSSEQSQLNDWYDNLSSKYDKVGNIIREVSFLMTHI